MNRIYQTKSQILKYNFSLFFYYYIFILTYLIMCSLCLWVIKVLNLRQNKTLKSERVYQIISVRKLNVYFRLRNIYSRLIIWLVRGDFLSLSFKRIHHIKFDLYLKNLKIKFVCIENSKRLLIMYGEKIKYCYLSFLDFFVSWKKDETKNAKDCEILN